MRKTFASIFSFFLIFVFSCSAQTTTEKAKTKEPSTVKTGETDKQEDEMVKCKDDDIDCFIRAAQTCRKASFTNNDSADFGANIFYKSDYFEIRGGSQDECKLYVKVLKWESVPNEKYLDELRKSGKKPPEVDQEMKELNDKRMKDAVGKDGVCAFTPEKLVALFKRWKNGRFSTEDYRGANCQGSYFTPENGFPKGF